MSNDRCISGSQEVVSFDSPAFHNYNYLWAEPRYEFPEASCGGFHKEPCKSSTMNRMSADRYLRRRTLVKSAAARELIAEVASIDKVDWSAVPPHYLTDSSIPSKLRVSTVKAVNATCSDMRRNCSATATTLTDLLKDDARPD